MGNTFKTGNYVNGIFQDASNNIGIGAAPSGTYKFEVTGTAKVSSTLLVSGAATFSSTLQVGSSTTMLDQLFFGASGANGNITWDGSYTYLLAGSSKGLSFGTNASANNRMVITSGGNVGIGTTTPLAQIESINYTRILGSANASTGVPASGKGLEFTYDSNADNGYILSVNRTTSALKGTIIWGSTISFGTDTGVSATERMRITSGGNVGIGTSSPNNILSLNSTSVYYIDFQQSGTSKGLIGVPFSANQLVGGSASGDIVIRNTSRNTIFTNDSGNTAALTINSSNIITLGSLGTGTVYATSGVLSIVSDMNFKIEDGFIDNALEKVMNLKPRYFLWKEESNLPTDLRQLGFYAQEVNSALGEEAANTPKENVTWGINDRAIIAMLTKAIQELNQLAQEQQATITSLNDRLTKAGI